MEKRQIIPNVLLKNGQKLLNAYINIEYNLPCVFGFDSETIEPVTARFLDVTWLDESFEDNVKSSDQPALTPVDKENIIASQTIGRKYSNAYDVKNNQTIFNAFIVGDKVYGYSQYDEPIISDRRDIQKLDGEDIFTLYHESEIDWETRRYEIAKSNLAGLMNIEALKSFKNPPTLKLYAKAAVAYADALIEELKNSHKC